MFITLLKQLGDNMKHVNILHLSDLHLNELKSENYESFKKVLFDRLKEFSSIPDIIVITGDIIDRGKYSLFQDIYDSFIIPLKKATQCDMIYCAPGNHDAERSKQVNQIWIENNWARVFNNSGKTKSYTKEDEKKFKLVAEKRKRENIFKNMPNSDIQGLFARYENYINFYKKLQPNIDKSYSVNQIKINRNNVTVRIISINSSVLSNDYDDFQHMVVSQNQLKDLCNEIKAQKLIKPDLSIAIMHHPMEWLTNYERNLLENYFCDPTKLPIDILMNGHTHQSKISNIMDLDNCIVNLVTGSAYNEIHDFEEVKGYNNCRFAYYSIDVDNKIIRGELSILNDSNPPKFVPDLSTYRIVDNKGTFTQIYGKNLLRNQINKINLPIDKTKVISSDDMILLDEIYEKLWKTTNWCLAKLKHIAKEYNDNLQNLTSQSIKKLKNDSLKDWLGFISTSIKTNLFDNNKSEVRIHFRKYNFDTNSHEGFVSTYGDKSLTPIPWKESHNLIYYSYECRRSLVKSCNPDKFFDTGNDEWIDFLTSPLYDYSEESPCPLLSFGISIKKNSSNLTKHLELLSFLRIESFLKLMRVEFDNKVFSIEEFINHDD